MTGCVLMLGAMALICAARSALACMKSICPKKYCESSISGMSGRIWLVARVSMRCFSRCSCASNSRIWLLASTTAVGSIYIVLPVADSSCTMPPILRLCIGETGSTSLPSLSVGVASLSMIPSACACLSMLLSVRDTEPCDASSCRRMCANSGVALSLICPNLSNMLSVSWSMVLMNGVGCVCDSAVR